MDEAGAQPFPSWPRSLPPAGPGHPPPDRPAARLRRLAVLSLHTSPGAALGFSANGGLNVYVREICASLAGLGVATDVFTRSLPGQVGPAETRVSPLVRIIHLPAGDPALDKSRLVSEVPAFAERVEEFVRGSGLEYDLLYSHYWLSGLAACTLRGRLRLPWAHTAHTLALVKNSCLAPDDRPESELRVDLEGGIARCADLLVVSTEAEAGALRRGYGVRPDRLATVVPGVDPEVFTPQPREKARSAIGARGDRVFLFVGRLEPLKGVELALGALAEISASHPDARLLVLGEDSGAAGGGEKQRLGELSNRLGLAGRVDFTGSVDQGRLPAYYSAAEACLVPSYTESFGLVGLEALACGTPVIASTRTGLASVLRDQVTGFLVAEQQPAAYAARMRALLEEPELSVSMGRRGRRLAERFTWKAAAARLAAHFEGLVGRQSGVQATPRLL